MAQPTFYVRIRGKVSGPYDVASIQKLVRRAMLSRIHEISRDGVTWNPAGEFEDLFASPGTALAAPNADDRPDLDDLPFAPLPPLPGEESAADVGSPAGPFYYAQDETVIGPVPLATLVALSWDGTLRPGAIVRQEGEATGMPASRMAALAPIFATGASRAGLQRRGTSAVPAARPVGVLAGGALLVLLNLPWAIVNHRVVWWWDLYRVPDASVWAGLITYLILAAVAVGAVALTVSGATRGLIYTAVTGFAMVLFFIAAVTAHPAAAHGLTVFGAASLAGLIGVCFAREAVPRAHAARLLQAVFGGAAVVGFLALGIAWAVHSSGGEGVPSSMIFGLALIGTGTLAGMAAGALGLAGLKDGSPGPLNRAAWACAAAALLLLGFGFFAAWVVGIDFSIAGLPENGEPQVLRLAEAPAAVGQALARMILAAYACLAVLAVGLEELLVEGADGQ